MPLPMATGSMSGRTVPAAWPVRSSSVQALRSSFSAGISSTRTVTSGSRPASRRRASGWRSDRVDQGEDQRVVPAPDVGLVEHGGQALLDHAGGVLVHRGQEQGLLVGEVGVGDRAADRGVPGDVGDRGGAEAVPAEPGDGGIEDGPPGLGPLRSPAALVQLPAPRSLSAQNRGFEKISQIVYHDRHRPSGRRVT